MMRHFIRHTLSLGLCCTLLTGLLPLGANAADPAAFPDAKDVGQWQAVAALSQLGVISGKDDGSFHPGDAVTRAEAAKMLTLLLGGGQEPQPQVMEAPYFQDISGHWARPYILYCASLGILEGRSEGIFDPDGQVTLAELSKMALTALGYEPTVFGLTGPDWEIDTNRNAHLSGLYNGITDENGDPLSTGLPVSRENAAQLLWNMLQAPVMLQSEDPDVQPGETVYLYSTKSADGQETSFFQAHFPQQTLPETPAQPK